MGSQAPQPNAKLPSFSQQEFLKRKEQDDQSCTAMSIMKETNHYRCLSRLNYLSPVTPRQIFKPFGGFFTGYCFAGQLIPFPTHHILALFLFVFFFAIHYNQLNPSAIYPFGHEDIQHRHPAITSASHVTLQPEALIMAATLQYLSIDSPAALSSSVLLQSGLHSL